MLSLLFARFWPILIPLGFYVLWLWVMSRRSGEDRKRVAEHLKGALLFWAVLVTVVLMIGSFIWWGVSQNGENDEAYSPAYYTHPQHEGLHHPKAEVK
jgi:hypothetical protein